MKIGKFFLIISMMTLSTTAFAEYYFVGNTCGQYNKKYYNNRVYKDTGAFYQSPNRYQNQNHRSTYAYSYYSHPTYNLDLITGDDDPYTYPGMNIDN